MGVIFKVVGDVTPFHCLQVAWTAGVEMALKAGPPGVSQRLEAVLCGSVPGVGWSGAEVEDGCRPWVFPPGGGVGL